MQNDYHINLPFLVLWFVKAKKRLLILESWGNAVWSVRERASLGVIACKRQHTCFLRQVITRCKQQSHVELVYRSISSACFPYTFKWTSIEDNFNLCRLLIWNGNTQEIHVFCMTVICLRYQITTVSVFARWVCWMIEFPSLWRGSFRLGFLFWFTLA